MAYLGTETHDFDLAPGTQFHKKLFCTVVLIAIAS